MKGFFFSVSGEIIFSTLTQTYCRKICLRAFFILGHAGINVKIWVWQLKRTDAQAVYCCSLSCSCSSGKISVKNVADCVNQLLWVLQINHRQLCVAFLSLLSYYRHMQTCKHSGTHNVMYKKQQTYTPELWSICSWSRWSAKNQCKLCFHEQSRTSRSYSIQCEMRCLWLWLTKHL